MKPKYLGRHLMVKGEYVDKILKGIKRATIRLGIVKPRYNEIIIHGGGRPVAKVRITKVRYKKLNELTDEDAKMDGFNSLEELLHHLRKAYGKISSNDVVTIIEFEVLKKLNEIEATHPYMGLEPADVARIALRYLKEELSEDEIKILLDLTRTNSIRKTAINFYGTIEKRYLIRRVLKKALKLLIGKGIIGDGK